jgi:hypothetical protein
MEAQTEALAFWLLFASKSDKIKIFERCLSGDKIDEFFLTKAFTRLRHTYFFNADYRRKDPQIYSM